MLATLIRWIGKIPLRLLHACGVVVGWLVYWLSPGYARRINDNLAISGICSDSGSYRRLLHAVIAQNGRALLELPAVWFRDDEAFARLVADCRGWDTVESLHAQGRSMIFLTPHMGCFEIAARYVSTKFPLTVMYRPQRSPWLDRLMANGRSHRELRLAPTSFKGVRMFSQALSRGESIGLLPDHAPGIGEGVWADFFGKPAFTMTLPRRLQQASGAALIMTFGERLPGGKGFRLHFEALPEHDFNETKLNHAIENLVRRFPDQYFWNYNRYKKMSRRGASSGPARAGAQ
ncbi:MAG: lysophospholipid acyltransferase family protein [Candidatus Binatia bacterium]